MTQQWSRLGIIHRPDTTKEWAAHGYCHVPTPIVMGEVVRVFYASLDANNRGSIGYCDLDGSDLTKVKYVSPDPVMRPGPLGAFDCDGVVPSWTDGERMYYIGFQRCESTPYMLYIGKALAIDPGGEWIQEGEGIVFDRNDEPFSCGAPFIRGDLMWYWSTTKWSDGHYNNEIRCAIEDENHDWIAAISCIDPISPDYAVGRPWVLNESGIYRMWYSSRGPNTYRMGYAFSEDGIHWKRRDDYVNSLMPDDGTNAEYPAIVDSGGKRWCIFNGAHNGRDGIELAVLEHE